MKLEKIIILLKDRKQSLGLAESCTGGKITARLVEIPGVSEVLQGAVVCYANTVKVNSLGVSKESLLQYGAVSEKVVLEMAHGARQRLSCDWAVAVSGIAGPTGGSAEKPVGTVWFAWVGPNFERSQKVHFKGDRKAVQDQAADWALVELEVELENILQSLTEERTKN